MATPPSPFPFFTAAPAPPIHGDPHLTSHLFPLIHAPPPPLYYSFPTPVCYPTAPTAFTVPCFQVQAPPLESTTPSTLSLPTTGAPPSTPCSTAFPFGSSPASAYAHDFVPTQAIQAAYGPNQPLPAPTPESPTESLILTSSPACGYSTEAAATLHQVQRELLNMQARLRSAMLKSRVSQCPVSTGKHSTSPSRMQLNHAPVPLTDQAQMLKLRDSEVNAVQHHATVPSAVSYVAPQVFDEMPTPKSCPRTYDISLDDSFEHQTPIQSSCVQVDSTKLSEQTLDGWPQAYGLHNLSRQSVFRADGTEHSYYALPTDYPLERATPAPRLAAGVVEMDVCSAELVDIFVRTPEQQTFERKLVYEDNACLNSVYDVFARTTEQQPYEEEKRGSGQAPKWFSKPIFSSERYTLGVSSLATGYKPDTDLCGKHVKPQVHNQQWNMQMIESGRKEWDPGTMQLIVDVPPVAKWSSSEGLTNAEISPAIQLSMVVYAATYIPNFLVSLPLYMLWDPGDQTILSSVLSKDIVSVQNYTPHVLLVLSASCMESTENRLDDQNIMANASSKVAVLTWHSSLPGTPFILLSNATFTWDPGVPEILHTYTATHPIGTRSNVLQAVFASAVKCFNAFELGWTELNATAALVLLVPCSKATTVQVTEERHHLEFILMTEMLQAVSEFSEAQPKCSGINVGPLRNDLQCQLPMSNTSCSENKFINQKGVHAHYKAKKLLLLSLKYLQIWEMDIIFITFLPP